ncbi:hypothetical protein HDU81_002763 [Chytriomyces hyalinus]|nr:hypothetical protein HDU81_002763 [Chytriomyces hyalinus]
MRFWFLALLVLATGISSQQQKTLPTLSIPSNNQTTYEPCTVCASNQTLCPTECGPSGSNPLHITLGSTFTVLVQYARNVADIELFLALAANRKSATSAFTSYWSLLDHLDPAAPHSGRFNPQDRHNPYAFVVKIPVNLTEFSSNYGLVYRAYGYNSTPYDEFIIRNLTLDDTSKSWTDVTNVNGSATITNTNPPESQPSWIFAVVAVAGGIVVLTAIGFSFSKYKRRKLPSRETKLESGPTVHVQSSKPLDEYSPHMGENPNASGNARSIHLYDDDDSDTELIVFKRSLKDRGSSYAASVNSKGGTSSVSMPHSILKTTSAVQEEAIKAQIYDSILSEHQMQQFMAAAENAERSDGAVERKESKKVAFKETVMTVVVDLTQPPVDDAVNPEGLFDDSEDGDYSMPHFNDGGLERDVKALLAREVRVEEDDAEYDSEKEDNDDWRKEE